MNHANAKGRPVFILRIRPLPRVDEIKALRFLLKALLRKYGFQCVAIEREREMAKHADEDDPARKMLAALRAFEPRAREIEAILAVLPAIGAIDGVDWRLPIGRWSQGTIVQFLLRSLTLVCAELVARGVDDRTLTALIEREEDKYPVL